VLSSPNCLLDTTECDFYSSSHSSDATSSRQYLSTNYMNFVRLNCENLLLDEPLKSERLISAVSFSTNGWASRRSRTRFPFYHSTRTRNSGRLTD